MTTNTEETMPACHRKDICYRTLIVFHVGLSLFRLSPLRFHPAVQSLVIVGVDLNDVAKGIFAVAQPVFVS